MTQSIVVFDLDHTLFKSNSSYLFGRFLYHRKHFTFRDFLFMIWCQLLFVTGLITITTLHQWAFVRLFKTRSAKLVDKWVDEFLDEKFDQLLYMPVYRCLLLAQKSDALTLLLSSSPVFLVEKIAKRLQISLWKATEYAIDKEGHFCDILSLMLGDDKALFVKELIRHQGLSSADVTAYSDSYLDLPLLHIAGKAIGVNPDRKLRAHCKKNKWLII